MADSPRPARRRPTGVHAPINAAEAAKRAAHVRPDEEDALRAAAAGTRRPRAAGTCAQGRSPRALTFAAVGIGAALALVLAFVLIRAIMGALLAPDARDAVESAQPASENQAVTIDADDLSSASVAYGLTMYAVRSFDDGVMRVVRSSTDAPDAFVSLFDISGTPVGLAVYNGTIYAVANLDGSYTVGAYVDADGSVPVQIAEESGTASDVALDGFQLKITCTDGKAFELDLESR